MRRAHFALAFTFVALLSLGWAIAPQELPVGDKFRQLEETLPTPNEQRTASGAPGSRYWQQRADYSIDVALDEDARTLTGSEVIRYSNQSPDELAYLWVQLDMNIFAPDSHSVTTALSPTLDGSSFESIRRLIGRKEFDGSAQISRVRDAAGN